MPPPRVGDLPRSMSMSLPTSPIRLENPQQTNPSINAGPQGPGPVAPPRAGTASAPTCSPATARARTSPPTTRSARAATGT